MDRDQTTAWLGGARAQVERALSTLFQDTWPASFAAPLRYPIETGGKRVRPALVYGAFEAISAGDRSAADAAAVAIELIHTYSLVHDDLPAMDDDDERRGRPTVHVAFDEPTAILVGDALLTEAFAVLAGANLPAEARLDVIARFARAAGHHGMVGGQVADIAGGVTDVDTLARLHRGKTGALIQAAAWAGGRVAGASPAQLAALDAYGAAVGLAFQLVDDLLDLEQDGPDGPPSFATLLGAEETRRRALALVDDANDALGALPHPAVLAGIARYIVERDL